MDRIEAIKSVARNLGDLIVDTTPASLSGSSIDAAELIQPISGQLKGVKYYSYSPSGVEAERIITDFNPDFNRMFFGQAVTASENTSFILTQYWRKADYDNALNRMIGLARVHNLLDIVATVELVATQYEYVVPSGMEFISHIRLVPSGNTNYRLDSEVAAIHQLQPRYWDIEPNPEGSYVIAFDARKVDLNVLDKQLAHIIGQAKPSVGTVDTAEIPAGLDDYIISGASQLLAAQRKGDDWRSKFVTYRQMTSELEEYIHSRRYGRKVA